MNLACLRVEPGQAFHHFVVERVQQVHLGVVLELVLPSCVVEVVVLEHQLALAERLGQPHWTHFEVALLPVVVPVDHLDGVGHLAFNVLSAHHLQSQVVFLLPQSACGVVSWHVQGKSLLTCVFHDGVGLTPLGAAVRVVSASYDKNLLLGLVLENFSKSSLGFEFGDFLIDKGLRVQPPDFVHVCFVRVKSSDSSDKVDVAVAVTDDGAAVLGLLTVVKAG